MFLFSHKLLKNMFESIIINDVELKQLKQISAKSNQSIILLPSFKSIVDFTLLSYVSIMYEMDLPFVNGLKEFDEIMLMSNILRKCGGFFVNT